MPASVLSPWCTTNTVAFQDIHRDAHLESLAELNTSWDGSRRSRKTASLPPISSAQRRTVTTEKNGENPASSVSNQKAEAANSCAYAKCLQGMMRSAAGIDHTGYDSNNVQILECEESDRKREQDRLQSSTHDSLERTCILEREGRQNHCATAESVRNFHPSTSTMIPSCHETGFSTNMQRHDVVTRGDQEGDENWKSLAEMLAQPGHERARAKLLSHDPLKKENLGLGPANFSTTSHSCFSPPNDIRSEQQAEEMARLLHSASPSKPMFPSMQKNTKQASEQNWESKEFETTSASSQRCVVENIKKRLDQDAKSVSTVIRHKQHLEKISNTSNMLHLSGRDRIASSSSQYHSTSDLSSYPAKTSGSFDRAVPHQSPYYTRSENDLENSPVHLSPHSLERIKHSSPMEYENNILHPGSKDIYRSVSAISFEDPVHSISNESCTPTRSVPITSSVASMYELSHTLPSRYLTSGFCRNVSNDSTTADVDIPDLQNSLNANHKLLGSENRNREHGKLTPSHANASQIAMDWKRCRSSSPSHTSSLMHRKSSGIPR